MYGPLDLDARLAPAGPVPTAELTPYLAVVLEADPGVVTESEAEQAADTEAAAAAGFGPLADVLPLPRLPRPYAGTFLDPLWLAYRRVWGVRYDRVGEFVGTPTIEVLGDRDYVFRGGGFAFRRHTGEVITPGTMTTDGGSVPRVVWAVPGLDPWTYLPAFLIHDWEFVAHHCGCGPEKSFEEVNDTLAEGLYTLMAGGHVPQDWRVLVAIKTAVDSFVGRRVWGRAWSDDDCVRCTKV